MTLTTPHDVDHQVAVVREVAARHAAETDELARFPVEALTAMRETGLLGLAVPVEHGGAGGTTADVVRVSSALSRDCTSVGMIFTMHCQQVATLARFAGPGLARNVLPGVARGEVYLASVTTEAGTGGHLLSSGAELSADRDVLHVDRFAPVVTGGLHADGFLITMRRPGAVSPGQVSLVYADRDQVELTAEGGWNPLGMRATHSVPMRITGDVPADQVVGEHGKFPEMAVLCFAPYAHLGWAACWLGAASGALARTVRMLREPAERKRRDLGSDLLLHRLSRVRERLDGVHSLIQHAVSVLASGADPASHPVQLLLNAVKLTASEQCVAAVEDLVELVGMRHGYLRNSPLALERALRDLRSAPLNYSNDRLRAADGALVLMDQEVRFARHLR
ncbi:alkylation response protein AidB-like acyl-CoA dehydrogenase [Saccharothrix coeruleofusca]|uniref:acyl-CoA dehydrogenase family protein n=1 Tax=Saccharothrix coeruleofusca TaxID=33919 RepID=UPI001AE441D3|nr:acyl-CoA dehydrogenase family protein [Saccharothrix coeruleofusca]MBP2336699.1 alkylation response protein AidB-like acyl-CoA dehydrogenase [Saccharothrix coeruleofusca]